MSRQLDSQQPTIGKKKLVSFFSSPKRRQDASSCILSCFCERNWPFLSSLSLPVLSTSVDCQFPSFNSRNRPVKNLRIVPSSPSPSAWRGEKASFSFLNLWTCWVDSQMYLGFTSLSVCFSTELSVRWEKETRGNENWSYNHDGRQLKKEKTYTRKREDVCVYTPGILCVEWWRSTKKERSSFFVFVLLKRLFTLQKKSKSTDKRRERKDTQTRIYGNTDVLTHHHSSVRTFSFFLSLDPSVSFFHSDLVSD